MIYIKGINLCWYTFNYETFLTFDAHLDKVTMNESYHCNPCNQDFPDKETATEHRDATGHELNIVKLENENK
jgi:hypothetical protein